MDRRGTADGRAGGGLDVTFGLAGGVEAPDGYSVMDDADGERRDEGEAEPGRGGDEACAGQ
jgi:hypothetical protein